MNTRQQGYVVKAFEGPRLCDIDTGTDMVMYRFICTRAHQLLSKITVYTTYAEQQRQPGVANVVAEQLKTLISNNGGRLSDCYIYEGGLLRATIIRHPRFKSAETAVLGPPTERESP